MNLRSRLEESAVRNSGVPLCTFGAPACSCVRLWCANLLMSCDPMAGCTGSQPLRLWSHCSYSSCLVIQVCAGLAFCACRGPSGSPRLASSPGASSCSLLCSHTSGSGGSFEWGAMAALCCYELHGAPLLCLYIEKDMHGAWTLPSFSEDKRLCARTWLYLDDRACGSGVCPGILSSSICFHYSCSFNRPTTSVEQLHCCTVIAATHPL